MNILAFDASTEYCSAALWLDGEIVSRQVHAGQTHSQLLLPQCQDLLAEAGLTFADLHGIGFGEGPGSFTGLRIACAVAQGLAFAADIPVAGISSLQALAVAGNGDSVIACLDARMGEVYHATYRREADEYVMLSEARVCKPQDVPAVEGDGWLGCGSGFLAYGDVLAQRYGAALAATQADIFPHARDIAYLAARKFALGEGMAAELATPLYIRNKVALKICER
ncbi:MAG: tRNA (adenosine(37)-N6)-threonylcarbamoyltransferase complex dimerization subunit type 1 TsaB [Sulfuriferula sp.]|nr:tRNA (adenosine(37)-N6)-threonylcarbamoyltransferase complex dimerization subunit type 1 TsaB [Sulfuriferula sp.]